MQPRLTLVGDVNPVTGYGQHLVRIARGLAAAGVYVTIRPLRAWEAFGGTIPADIRAQIVAGRQPEEWELLLATGQNAPTPGRRTIFYTMWESTELPHEYVRNINQAHAVIVPCVWNKRVFEDNGVTRPIFVVPLGIDPEAFEPTPIDEGMCWFVTAGRILHGGTRKGVNEVIRVFKAAFPNETDVRLRVKVHPDDPVDIPEDLRIQVIREHWTTEEQVADFLQGATAFVSGAAGEGWGLWQHQAMACGRPVIAAIYGGLREFMTPENSYPVSYTEEPAIGFPGKWSAPDWGAMIKQMRRVYLDRIEAQEKGERAAKRAHNFTWAYSIDKLLTVLNLGGAVQTSGNNSLHAPTPCRDEFKPVYHPPVLAQVRQKGWEGGYIAFPPGDRMHFNPGLVQWEGKRLLFTRQARFSNGHRVENRIVCYELDRWKAVNPKVILPGRNFQDREVEDPRCFVNTDGRVVMSFTALFGAHAQQLCCILDSNLEPHSITRVPYAGNSGDGWEKNWMWFQPHGETLRFVYEAHPHTVISVDRGVRVDEWKMHYQHHWQFGRPRGGTPPILIGDIWYSFFHSCLPWKKERLQYYMGVYTFENVAPYRPLAMSRLPLLAGSPNAPEMIQPHSVVYPTGALCMGDRWTVVGGENDEACFWCEIPHEQVERALLPL